MKNFPHQFNKLAKIIGALRAADNVLSANNSLSDDEFGVQLLQSGINTAPLRHETSIDEYLRIQRAIPVSSDRSYLTFARNTNEFLRLLGLLEKTDDRYAISAIGRLILTANDTGFEAEFLRQAFLDLELVDSDGERSHPYQILLKLVAAFPGIATPKLMLALEAVNDSEIEFERIASLVPKELSLIVAEIGTTEPQARNAVKILPGVAVQLGDIVRRNNSAWLLSRAETSDEELEVEAPHERWRAARPAGILVPVTLDKIGQDRSFGDVAPERVVNIATSIKLTQQRHTKHQAIVRSLAQKLDLAGFLLFEGQYDCVAQAGATCLLFEVKTITKALTDQTKQTIKGVGQLKFYAFSLRSSSSTPLNVLQFLVYSEKPNSPLLEFCRDEQIMCIWQVDHSGFEIQLGETVSPFDPHSFLA